ncbi:hypothetical protein MJO28_003246 [Puccinia striiformis f. sp. tritici]|uniref:YDG domain-containing protein n=4 Tax=Puccinia striiformis f. sp. tritici TaxID=168172 RepID=A0A0L0VF80_9BASI|nr:hypothetical protein Pst134EA_004840 [Puccinia striiformis f. sp. tritici]KAH9462015.1 hypothetical protein Pst134EB_005933 [Puccinia striiformis f. sp. tritici]KAH9470928.1 hypothetical protein Pst134EA_004840 [Puccinia striiformis f. sp. tritici]KAI7959455.1 hypothetical protein MJO28_003246 [Puccinia striiformis f. sp. tritici]KNE97918.1 hypothetical protein PSTG_08792 [Puccinia striiformis f. sp. tritici PST-78]
MLIPPSVRLIHPLPPRPVANSTQAHFHTTQAVQSQPCSSLPPSSLRPSEFTAVSQSPAYTSSQASYQTAPNGANRPDPKVFGHIPGAPPGTRWDKRAQVSQAGVHAPPQGGISGTERRGGAESVVLNDGYPDGDCGNIIWYMGSGGFNIEGTKGTSSIMLKSQDPDNRFNAALQESFKTGNPVRVVRGSDAVHSPWAPKSGYRYDGLYEVTRVDKIEDPSMHTRFTCVIFRMERLERDQYDLPIKVGYGPVALHKSDEGQKRKLQEDSGFDISPNHLLKRSQVNRTRESTTRTIAPPVNHCRPTIHANKAPDWLQPDAMRMALGKMKFSINKPPVTAVVPEQPAQVQPSEPAEPQPCSTHLPSPPVVTCKPTISHSPYVRYDRQTSHPYYRPNLPPRPQFPLGDSSSSTARQSGEPSERPSVSYHGQAPAKVPSAPTGRRSPLMSLPSPPRKLATPPRRMSSPLDMWPFPTPPSIARKSFPPASTEQQSDLPIRPASPAAARATIQSLRHGPLDMSLEFDVPRPEKLLITLSHQNLNLQLEESHRTQSAEPDSPHSRCSSLSLDSHFFRDPSPAGSNVTIPTAPHSPVDCVTSEAFTQSDGPFTVSFASQKYSTLLYELDRACTGVRDDSRCVSMDLDSPELDELKPELDELKHDMVNLPDPQPTSAINSKQEHSANFHPEIAIPDSLEDTMSSSDLDDHIPWSEYDESEDGEHVPWSECDESEVVEAEMTNLVSCGKGTVGLEQNEEDELEGVEEMDIIINFSQSGSNDSSKEVPSTGINETRFSGETVSNEDEDLDGEPLLSDDWWSFMMGYQTISPDHI